MEGGEREKCKKAHGHKERKKKLYCCILPMVMARKKELKVFVSFFIKGKGHVR